LPSLEGEDLKGLKQKSGCLNEPLKAAKEFSPGREPWERSAIEKLKAREGAKEIFGLRIFRPFQGLLIFIDARMPMT
jgi:hypothetical protein